MYMCIYIVYIYIHICAYYAYAFASAIGNQGCRLRALIFDGNCAAASIRKQPTAGEASPSRHEEHLCLRTKTSEVHGPRPHKLGKLNWAGQF